MTGGHVIWHFGPPAVFIMLEGRAQAASSIIAPQGPLRRAPGFARLVALPSLPFSASGGGYGGGRHARTVFGSPATARPQGSRHNHRYIGVSQCVHGTRRQYAKLSA